jgi:hypothetical protein
LECGTDSDAVAAEKYWGDGDDDDICDALTEDIIDDTCSSLNHDRFYTAMEEC